MNGAIRWMIRNEVTANLLMLFILVAGAFGALNLRKQVFPEFTPDIVNISVAYPGATPIEVEESIIHGHSNKYHDGFLGHAYVGEWVNLGALTTNSDLKNDYTSVSVMLDGRRPIDTGSTKVGSLSRSSACSGVFEVFRTGVHSSRAGASKAPSIGWRKERCQCM